MKKLYALVIAIIIALPFYAQPTFDFEGASNWSPNPFGTPAYDTPKGWACLNILSNSLAGSNPISVFKSTDVHGGTTACKIKTVYLNSPPSGWYLQDTIGLMVAGNIGGIPPAITYGYAYASRPTTLEFWAKYTPNGADTASAAIVLLHDNGSGKDTIGAAYLAIATTTVSSYTKYVMPIIYNPAFPSTNPDTAVIAFASSGENRPQVNSELLIDDIFLGFLSGVNENETAPVISFYPNPAQKEINFSFPNTAPTSVTVISIAGQHIGTFAIENKALKLNTEKLAAGSYLFVVKDKDNTVIDNGKFSVAH